MAVSIEKLWHDYLIRSRWFQGKGLPVTGVRLEPLDWYTTDSPVWVRSELAEVRLGRISHTYHLLVGYLPAGEGDPAALVGRTELAGRGMVDIVDAPRSPAAMAALLAALRSGTVPGITWETAPPGPGLPTGVLPGEQSNTTVTIGETVLFKIFRRITEGQNLEVEVLRALGDSAITPRLIGTLADPGTGLGLGLFTGRIQGARDGWKYTLRACREDRRITGTMNRLGATLRTLHESLATVFPVASGDADAISGRLLARLGAAARELPELEDLQDRLAPLLTLAPGAVDIQRIHGDFHLGQALLSPTGWTIIDFEGEPLKSAEERAAPDSVWRDVAGLTRSLDYARSHHPDPGGDAARRWFEDARGAFLDGYASGSPLATDLLAAYEIDKTIYELLYEIRNRPDWAAIPRRALAEAIAT